LGMWLLLHRQQAAEKLGRLPELLQQLQQGFGMIAQRFHATKIAFAQNVLTPESAREASLVWSLTLLVWYGINVITNLSLMYAALLVYAWKAKTSRFSSKTNLVLIGYILINITITLSFFAEHLFLTNRYLLALSLTLMLWLPFALEKLLTLFYPSKRWLVYGLASVMVITAGFVSFGYSKRYVRNAGDWLASNVPTQSGLYANDIQLMYYSKHFGSDVLAKALIFVDPTSIAQNKWKQYDYIALRLNPKVDAVEAGLEREIAIAPIQSFKNKRGDRVDIFKVPHEGKV
jgi:hypothetical protein